MPDLLTDDQLCELEALAEKHLLNPYHACGGSETENMEILNAVARLAHAVPSLLHEIALSRQSEAYDQEAADVERRTLRAEVEQLARWKAEALLVMTGLQDLGKALNVPLGSPITGETAAKAAMDLRTALDEERARSARYAQRIADQSRTMQNALDVAIKETEANVGAMLDRLVALAEVGEDGKTTYRHNHGPIADRGKYVDCPACWAESILKAIGGDE